MKASRNIKVTKAEKKIRKYLSNLAKYTSMLSKIFILSILLGLVTKVSSTSKYKEADLRP